MTSKIRYEIDLQALAPSATAGRAVRAISVDDLDALARLMLDAYVGTIDYDDETLDDAVDEVEAFCADPLARLDCSFAIELDGEIVSAVLVTTFEDQPLVAYVMTAALAKGRGLAGVVTLEALHALKSNGETGVTMFITEGNTASERLFESLGAVRREA